MGANVFQYSKDIYSWCNTASISNCTIGQDPSEVSPANGISLVMNSYASYPRIDSYNDFAWNLTNVYNFETSTISVWVKTNSSTSCSLFLYEANNLGETNVAGASSVSDTFSVDSNWRQISVSMTHNWADIAYIQVRIYGGYVSGGATWFDGLEVYKTGFSEVSRYVAGINAWSGYLPTADHNDVSLNTFRNFQVLLGKSVGKGNTFQNPIVSTYQLIETTSATHRGGVIALNGDIHFAPRNATVGQKINSSGVVSTYSLIYTVAAAYAGGVLAPNGDIHFNPNGAAVGQKVDMYGTVSTYSLVYTAPLSFGGVLNPNGEIIFGVQSSVVGQKISKFGIVSTYSLISTGTNYYSGAVLAPNGDVHFIPRSTTVGQKIDTNGVVSTYSLVYTLDLAFICGALASNGDIHFVPYKTTVGQKIDMYGVVSTYSLVYTNSSGAYIGGVLAPNGDIHFAPYTATVGQKIDINGVVSTYSLAYTTNTGYFGSVIDLNGNIHLMPTSATIGQKISTMPAVPFSLAVSQSPFLNKY